MNYHNITKDEMLNGEGLGVVLWVAGCSHRCPFCQNPETWSKDSGIPFDEDAKAEIFEQLEKDYISRLTLSGGDPMFASNVNELLSLVRTVKSKYPKKKIWIYTGYEYEYIMNDISNNELQKKRKELLSLCDILVDGKFKQELASEQYYWAGSTNQRVINVQRSLLEQKIVLI